MEKCVIRRRVEYAETDMAGIVHFSQFFRYMESAEHALFRQAGLSVVMQQGDRCLSWPRVSCGFEFSAPLRFEEEFEVSIWITNIGNKSLAFRSEVLGPSTLCASGTSTSVCCWLGEGGAVSSMPIPGNIRKALSAYLVDA